MDEESNREEAKEKRETKSKQKENDQQILASRVEGPLEKMNNTANDRFHDDHIIESCTAILRPAPQISFEAELHDLPPATPVSRSIYQSGLYQTTPPDAQRQ